ncbi:MAG: ubiquinol-cytochrome c reductase iron-sulfur subunit [Candidatus Melainabacteria bacterium]|nr:ubiquinol-cytochrome c reductase iron-sulfur subunit [Candidatus Melainabacteria bacterium]
MDRRIFLKFLASLPVLGAFTLFSFPMLNYLRPTLGPLTKSRVDTKGPWTEWEGVSGLVSTPDKPQREKDIRFKLSDFPAPWSSQTFTFGQKSREYTFRHFQSTRIPGFVVRLPEMKDGKPDFHIVSRICPHMGCVFNYLPEPSEAANYNYPQAKTPLFACPCHLSVFDPLQRQEVGTSAMRGKVVSGPAPRPPRSFVWQIEGNDLIITEAEAGGIS